MKKQTYANIIIRSALALALALAVWSPLQSQAAGPVEEKSIKKTEMMEDCREMMERKQKMMAEIKAQDAQLNAQVAEMNSAPTDKKLDLIAAVVTRMVEQRSAMHEQMGKMHEGMMAHMMQHMRMGDESMSQCPMMKGMKGMKGMKSSDDKLK